MQIVEDSTQSKEPKTKKSKKRKIKQSVSMKNDISGDNKKANAKELGRQSDEEVKTKWNKR